ncbi:MAG: hypothetical protein KAH21_02165 [Spirochaetaceae bacterium]|nr:hypothetical protein [Spirochaetaceae bacterium]
MNIKLLAFFGFLLTSTAVLQAEHPETSSIKISDQNGTIQAELTADGYAPDGIKFVWSLNPNPVYPPKDGDRAEFRSLEDSHSFKPEAFAGPGKYYVRAGWYSGGRVTFYSDTIEMNLGSAGGVVIGEGRSIGITVEEQLVRVSLTVTADSKPDGVKIVWSRTPDPEYPNREGDRYIYRNLDASMDVWLDSFDGSGTYYIRAGWYKSGRILFYSTQVETVLR